MDQDKLLELFHSSGKLKTTARAGWLRAGVPEIDAESVAEHTFRTAFIAMILGDLLKLDTGKILKLALLHDLAEAVIGDITPHDDITVQEKLKNEENAIKDMFKGMSKGDEYIALWQEYSLQRTEEAKLVRCIDKFEMALQASEYQTTFPDKDFNEFFADVEMQMTFNEVQTLFEAIKKTVSEKKR